MTERGKGWREGTRKKKVLTEFHEGEHRRFFFCFFRNLFFFNFSVLDLIHIFYCFLSYPTKNQRR